MAEVEYILDNMEAGFSTDSGLSAPNGTGSAVGKNGALWSDLCGLFPREGGLRFAFDGGSVISSGLTIDGNSTSAAISNAQRLRYAFRRSNSAVSRPEVLVTSREVFIDSAATSVYTSVNPLYTTGTVDTDGAGNVTGAGTAWTVAHIQPGMVIQFAGADTAWYTIATVAAAALTLTANGPNVAAGTAYKIRRCFGGNASVKPSTSPEGTSKNRIFAAISNGDLYVAGSTVLGDIPGIIKITNVFNSPAAAANSVTTIILSPSTLNSTVAAKSVISTLTDIVGMQLLPDGRLLIATHEYDSGATAYFYRRVRTNSITDPAEWNDAASTYFNDLLGPAGPCSGLGRLGESFTAHSSDGIMLGNPTAQQDPPLTWSQSQATRGATCPELLGTYPGGDFFLGWDLRAYLFDGGREQPMTDFTIQKTIQSPSYHGTVYLCDSCCAYDSITSSFHFMLNKWDTKAAPILEVASDFGCSHFIIREENKQVFRLEWPSVIGCLPSSPATPSGDSRIYVGRASSNQAPAALGRTSTNSILGYFQYEQWSGDEADPSYAAVPPISTLATPTEVQVHAVTNWIDFREPVRLKTLKKIEVWFRGAAGTAPGDRPTGPPDDEYKIRIECRPMAANPVPPFGQLFPEPSEFTLKVQRSHSFDGSATWVPMVLDEMNIGRAFFDPDPMKTPKTQALCGTHFRIGIWPTYGGFALPSYYPRGIWRVRVVAELGGDPLTVDGGL